MRSERKRQKCPICKKEITQEENEFSPFCGKRCQLIDLGSWADESYKVGTSPKDDLDSFEDDFLS